MATINNRQSKFNPFILALIVVGVVAIGYFVFRSFAASSVVTVKAAAGAYVSQQSPTTSFANPATLKTNGGSAAVGDTEHSFLKFNVANLPGPVTKAELRLYATNANANGYSVKSVATNTWDPATVTYNNAPAVGTDIGQAAGFAANTWTSVDVTSAVNGNGTFSFALWPRDTNESTFAGFGQTNAPQLVITTNAVTAAAPVVSFAVPSNGQTVSGNAGLSARATSSLAITRVDYFQNNTLIKSQPATIYGAPIVWDTTKVANGTYTIKAVAYDTQNQSGSATISVNVNNATTPPPPAGITRAAFYYPWFPGAWNQQGLNPFTHYHPTLGYYSSSDPNIVSQHIAAMKYAGLNAGIASWWGQNSTEDANVGTLLQQAAGTGFKWSLYYECEGNSTGGACTTLSPSVSQITSDLNYIKGKYAGNDSYLKINNKPVLFVYGDSTDSCTTATNWKQANAAVGNSFYIVLKVFANYATCANQPDNWHQYGPASAIDSQAGHSFAISPGFFKANEATPRLARDLTRWNSNIDAMVASKAPLQLVTTFNEWGEGSSIESASEWASVSGYGAYIDALHAKLVGSCTSNCNPTPAVLLSPANGATVNGLVKLAALTNLPGANLATFSVDNTVINTSGPTATQFGIAFNQTWDSSGLSGNHTIKVSVTNSQNQSVQATSTVNVANVQACTTAPTAPTNLTATPASSTSKTVNLSWGASSPAAGCSITAYIITRTPAGGTATVINTNSTGLGFADTTTNFNTTYTYTVAALDNANHVSAPSGSKSVTTPPAPVTDTQAPDVPALTATVASTTQVNLSWNAVADNPKTGGATGTAGYKVFRNGSQIAQVTAPNTSVNDSFSFASGTSYSYTVLAFDAATPPNQSAQSAAKSVIPNPQVSSGARCGNAATGNKINTVIVISEENRTWSSVGGAGFASGMPYAHQLATECAYYNPMNETEPDPQNSATQYVGAWTGFGSAQTHVNNDCQPSTSCSYTGNNIFRVFRTANIPHREYVEGASSTCSASGNAAKHIPELYMWDAADRAACGAEVLPLTQFNWATPPTGYSFITPTLCNDGHDCSNSTVDSWLSNSGRLPAVFNSAAYKQGRVLVEIWYDEDRPKPNLFACYSCKKLVGTNNPAWNGESLLWVNLLGAPAGNLGAISTATDIRSQLGTP